MPSFSRLLIETMICPICKNLSTIPGGVVKFQWGKIPHCYNLGDDIIWLMGEGNTILSQGKVIDKSSRKDVTYEWNCGNREYKNLYVFDSDPNIMEFECSECSTKISHLAVEIRQNKLAQVHAFTDHSLNEKLGEIDDADIVIINDDGSFLPRPDWNDISLW